MEKFSLIVNFQLILKWVLEWLKRGGNVFCWICSLVLAIEEHHLQFFTFLLCLKTINCSSILINMSVILYAPSGILISYKLISYCSHLYNSDEIPKISTTTRKVSHHFISDEVHSHAVWNSLVENCIFRKTKAKNVHTAMKLQDAFRLQTKRLFQWTWFN